MAVSLFMEFLQKSTLIDQSLLLDEKKASKVKKIKNKCSSKLVTKRIIIIALFSSLTVVIRLIFALIQWIEVSNFLLLSFALFIPLKDATIIGMITVFLSSLILGLGTWTAVPFIYYTLSILIIWCLKPVLNNRWTFNNVLAFFSGPWVVFWYFLWF